VSWIRIAVSVVAIAAIDGVWIAGTVRWTRRHGNLARRSPRTSGSDDVDELDRARRRPHGAVP
jgi:hypothetical protein